MGARRRLICLLSSRYFPAASGIVGDSGHPGVVAKYKIKRSRGCCALNKANKRLRPHEPDVAPLEETGVGQPLPERLREFRIDVGWELLRYPISGIAGC